MELKKPWIFPRIALGFTIAYPFVTNHLIATYDDWHLSNIYGKEIFDTDILRPNPLKFICIQLIVSVLAIILCLLLKKSKKDKLISGTAIILNIFMLLIYPMIYPLMFIGIPHNKKIGQIICMGNMKSIGLAISLYSDDYDSHIPPLGSNWNSLLKKYKFYHYDKRIIDNNVLHCPIVRTSKDSTYAINKKLTGINTDNIKNQENTIAIFESKPGKNLFGSKELLPKYPRHNGGENYVFFDGHAKWISREGLDFSNFQPEIEE